MDTCFSEDDYVSLCSLFYALSLQGDFNRSSLNRLLGEELSKGFDAAVLRTVFSQISTEAMREATREVEYALSQSIRVICFIGSDYPQYLREIADPPLVLFVRGQLPSEPGVAIVGTRGSSSYGEMCALTMSRELTERGAYVVSGLAYGIDAAAHRGALRGATGEGRHPGVAVLGSGVMSIYPAAHRGLAGELLENGGALVSEYGVQRKSQKWYFPRRNRIISGLSRALIVVEAPMKSGALITARFALEQGREVYALPGRIDCSRCSGTNKLIQDGAFVITGSEDEVFSQMVGGQTKGKNNKGGATSGRSSSAINELAEGDRPLAEHLLSTLASQAPCHFDHLVQTSGQSPARIGALLSQLEVFEVIRPLPGNEYALCELPR